jgi:hypothetical protein
MLNDKNFQNRLLVDGINGNPSSLLSAHLDEYILDILELFLYFFP